MDWDRAIRRNRDDLLRIVAALFALAGLAENRIVATLPRHLRRSILLVLRPAESAMRRLIVIAARGLVVDPPPEAPAAPTPRSKRAEPGPNLLHLNLGLANYRPPEPPAKPARREPGIPAFPLFDPFKRFETGPRRRRFTRRFPRITCLHDDATLRPVPPPPPPPGPDDPLDARRLCRRLHSLKRALDDLPAQARRLARWRVHKLGPRRWTPLRPGYPPGRRKRPVHAVDEVLKECHALAWDVLREPDSP